VRRWLVGSTLTKTDDGREASVLLQPLLVLGWAL